jgi:two-component system sensor histidine kinase ChvG
MFLYSALPIERSGESWGAVYVSRSTKPVHSAMHRLRSSLYRFALAVMMVTAILSLFLAATISRPLVRLQRVAARIAAGERRSGSIDRELSRLGRRHDELGEVARAVDAMERELDDRARGVADMAANISHEFKSPLTSIRGATELLLDGAAEDATTRKRFLENMLDDSERLDRLVTRLLELTRVPADLSPAEDFDYNQLCEQAVRAADAVFPVRLRYSAPSLLHGRSAQLVSVLRNLIDNAQQHAAPGTVVTVEVEEAVDHSVVTTVHNVGRPIGPSSQNKIWTRFYTTRAARGGTGLGLPIVAAIVSAHGGQVAVDSSAEDGTTFSFTLPASSP